MTSQTIHNNYPMTQAIGHLLHPEERLKTYHLFVYGTLKRGHMNYIRSGLKKYGRFIKDYQISGYKLMYNPKTGIPVIVESSRKDSVDGEIHIIGERYKSFLDTHQERFRPQEISPGIWCYVIDNIPDTYRPVPLIDSSYNWTKAMELTSVNHNIVELTRRRVEQHKQLEKPNETTS